MSKSILHNVSDAQRLVAMETEELAGYVLEHLQACGGNPVKEGNGLPHNLANGLALSYSANKDEVYKRIVAACHWLINNGYLDVINGQGFFEISKKGNSVKTAAELAARLNPPPALVGGPQPKHDFPKIGLSDAEMMWLRIICNRFLSGYLADVNQLKKTLRAQGKWPANFRPSEIDYRLYQRENIPTFLGIWHADPETKWIPKFDELIRLIKDKLSETTDIKIDELAQELQLTDLNVTILIHLLPSIGFGYTAVGKPGRQDIVAIPGQLEVYDRLQLDDPEKMDALLAYDNLEAQLRKFYGDNTDEDESDADGDHKNAISLYQKVKGLMESGLDGETARIVVESADDAIKEFGSTNQEKKVELRKWKAQAELELAPGTIEELRKRAEGQLLTRVYPGRPILRNALLSLVAITIVGTGILGMMKFIGGGGSNGNARLTASPVSSETPDYSAHELNADPLLLHPALREKTNRLLENARATGLNVFIYQTYRSPREQHELWLIGRTEVWSTNDPAGAVQESPVTPNDAWDSLMQYGLAVKILPFGGGQWNLQPNQQTISRLSNIAAGVGLVSRGLGDGLMYALPDVHIHDLKAGRYPPGGDKSWGSNLNGNIDSWGSKQPNAPPKVPIEE